MTVVRIKVASNHYRAAKPNKKGGLTTVNQAKADEVKEQYLKIIRSNYKPKGWTAKKPKPKAKAKPKPKKRK